MTFVNIAVTSYCLNQGGFMPMETLEKEQFIFANIFIISNRLKTACEKIQTDITMKQWLMLAISSSTNEKKSLTQIGKLMGCSRQNIKKLAQPLKNKGYINFLRGNNNSVQIVLTDKCYKYFETMNNSHLNTLNLLFRDFSDSDIQSFFVLLNKLESGLQEVEKHGDSTNEYIL